MLKSMEKRHENRDVENTALVGTRSFLNYLFTSDEACKEYRSIGVLRGKGARTLKEFRRHIIQTTLEIMESGNPATAICKRLILNAERDCANRLLWTEEFNSRRQVIYDGLNQETNSIGTLINEEPTARESFWNESETICLLNLQKNMFGENYHEEWWVAYVKLREEHIKYLYRSILDEADGKESSLYDLLAEVTGDNLTEYEHKLMEEAEKIQLRN